VAPLQRELAERLAGLLPQMQPAVGHMYFSVFVLTIRREWAGIDRLRLDKFMMLIRKLWGSMFRTLAAAKW
jgi:ribosomal RNA-processing protein 1